MNEKQQETGRCDICGHDDGVDEEGICRHLSYPRRHRAYRCQCKCVYSATGAAVDLVARIRTRANEIENAGNDSGDKKDGEFIKGGVSALRVLADEIEDGSFTVATTGAGAERADVWKIVFDVVSEHAYYGSRELVKQLETARGRDGYGPQGEPPATVTERETQYGGFADHADMAAPATVAEGRCDFCDHPSGFLPAELEGGQWIHRGRDNEAEVCAATPHKCTECGEIKTSPECLNCSALGVAAIESEAKIAIANESRSSAPGPAAAPVVETAQGGPRRPYCQHCHGKGWFDGLEIPCRWCNPGGEFRSLGLGPTAPSAPTLGEATSTPQKKEGE